MSKKYDNPINKPVMVAVPRWEYAALVRASTLLEATEKLVNNLSEYQVRDALKALYSNAKEDAEA